MKKIFSLIGVAMLGVAAYAWFSNEASVDKTWSFNPLTPIAADQVSGGNLTGSIQDVATSAWSNMYNNAAIEKAELTTAEGVVYPNTAGLKFTAGGSKWIYFRNYSNDFNGPQLFSNNKNLKMYVPAAAGKAVILKAMSASGNLVMKGLKGAGTDTVEIAIPFYGNNKYDYYMFTASADTVEINLPKQLTIQEVKVCDVPTQEANALEVTSESSVTLEIAQTSNITCTATNPQTPITYTSADPNVATVENGVITGKASGETTITVAQAANPYYKAASQTINVKVKKASVNLVQAIAAAVAGKNYGDTAVVNLDGNSEYKLDTIAPAGLVNLVINGNGAVVNVGEKGQLSAKVNLAVNKVNFNCANETMPLIVLPRMTEKADSVLYNKYGANGKNAFFMDAITLDGVNISGLTKSLIQSDEEFAVEYVTILNSIIQLNCASGKPFINFQAGANGEKAGAMIRYIDFENSTFYNTQKDDIYLLAYNQSKPMPAKYYGADKQDGAWTLKNNTFAQVFGKQFSDRYTENKVDTLVWTKNVFYNVGNLTKTRNCSNNFTAADNSVDGATASTNKNYGTIDNTLITIPTEAFDFDENSLLENFGLLKYSYAFKNKMGDPRWLQNIKKTYPTRSWDFTAIPTDYAEDWNNLKTDSTGHWTYKSNRCFCLDTLSNAEVYANNAKIGFLEGLYFTTNGKEKVIAGDASQAKYKCIQVQKGSYFTIQGAHAADTVFITGSTATSSAVVDGAQGINLYPAKWTVQKSGSYTTDTLIVLADGDVTIKSAGADYRIQKVILKAFDGDYVGSGLDFTMKTGNLASKNTNLRMAIGATDSIQATTNNQFVPVTYTSTTESVATVSADGVITPIAAGIDTIRMTQAAAGKFTETVKEMYIVVLPQIASHVPACEIGQFETLYTPDAIGVFPDNSYYVVPEYASWIEYINATNGYDVVTGKKDDNCWMKIDYRDGANDSTCSVQCPAGATGTNAMSVLTVYNTTDVRSLNYYVTAVDSVKFYYSSTASKDGALKFEVYSDVDSILSVTGAYVTGKKANGGSATVGVSGLDPNKHYVIKALREGGGDIFVYAVKFRRALATAIEEVETSENANFITDGIYNLRGQKVNNVVKGQIYIVNGRKFMAK